MFHTVNIIAFFIGYHGDAKGQPHPFQPSLRPPQRVHVQRKEAWLIRSYFTHANPAECQPSILLKEDERFQAASGSGTGRQLL